MTIGVLSLFRSREYGTADKLLRYAHGESNNEQDLRADPRGFTALLPEWFRPGCYEIRRPHLPVLVEDQKVRVARYAPSKGDKTPMRSHPAAVVYVLKIGRVKYPMPDGSTGISVLNTGQASMRPPVMHFDGRFTTLRPFWWR